jgi:hypothetical protein
MKRARTIYREMCLMHRDSNKKWTKVKNGFQEKIFQGSETIKPENKNFNSGRRGKT